MLSKQILLSSHSDILIHTEHQWETLLVSRDLRDCCSSHSYTYTEQWETILVSRNLRDCCSSHSYTYTEQQWETILVSRNLRDCCS